MGTIKKRIIPCLDIKDGRTVKGVNFEGLRDAGDPVELAKKYSDYGADELVFLDITATQQKRKTLSSLVDQISRSISIPFTVGGGVTSPDQVYDLLYNGADKISINSSAVRRPQLIADIASRFGTQCTVLAVDARFEQGDWQVYISGGKIRTELKLSSWCKEAVDLGCGEILFTSMDHDGTKSGFAIEALQKLSSQVSVPVIASGGAGAKEHFWELFQADAADAALAASVFHFGEIPIPSLKSYLANNNINVRSTY